MDIYEELVMRYLCDGKPNIFLCPNFRLDRGRAFPDFVVLDLKEKIVTVVEVTTNANPVSLVEKVENRKGQWLDKLKERLQEWAPADPWQYKVEVFVREDARKKFDERFASQSDVKITTLDQKILNCWEWDWSERE